MIVRLHSSVALMLLVSSPFAPPASAQLEPVITESDEAAQAMMQDLAPDGRPLTEVQISVRLRDLVSRLDDPAFDVREAAAREIVSSTIDRAQVYALLARDELTPEQRYRLLQSMREYLIKLPRGAVGVRMEQMQFGMAVPGGGVRVAELLPGLPAERVLLVGDRIMSIDGQPLTVTADLQRQVQNRRPGEKITLQVKRSRIDDRGDLVLDANNQPVADDLTFELTLGSSELLKNEPLPGQPPAQPSPVELARAQEAALAATKFAPPILAVAIKTEDGHAFSPSESNLVNLIARNADARIDAHPAIRTLVEDLVFIEQGLQTETPALLTWWNDQLNSLRAGAENGTNSAETREYYRKVAARYQELLDLRLQ